MSVIDLCKQSPVCIEKGSAIADAAKLMKAHHIGGVIVLDSIDSRKPVGIVTDRDIALGVSNNLFSPKTKVENVMSRSLVTIMADQGIASVIERMENEGVRRVVVLDQQGRACGLVTADDIIELLAREMSGLGKLVQKQIQNEKIHGNYNNLLMT